VAEGHRVTVFTSSENVRGLPKSERVNGADVYRIKRDLVTTLRLYKDSRKRKNPFLNLFYKLYSIFVAVVMSRRWPQKSVFTPIRYARLAKRVLKGERVDAIVGTYFHIEEVLAAIRLKRVKQEAVMITYTLDALTGRKSPLIFGKEKYARRSIEKWEKYVFDRSDRICVMESHRNHYESGGYSQDVQGKLRYVDVPLLAVKDEPVSSVCADGIKRIVYTGSASVQTGSPRYMMELLSGMDGVELHMYGATDEAVRELIACSDLTGKTVFHHGFVDHGEVTKALEAADLLVTFGSQNECMVSGKIFEYMSKKKPIVAFYQIEDDANVRYLEKYPNALILKEYGGDPAADAARLRAFILKEDFEKVSNDYLQRTFYKNTPQAMVHEILCNLPKEESKN
jgi:glycosyltransferase involved in cell wall biosynthesis